MGSSGQAPGQIRGSQWCLGALSLLDGPRQNRWEHAQAPWKGPGMSAIGSGTWRPQDSWAASLEPSPVHPTVLALPCSPLFKQYPYPRCDWTQKPASGTNSLKRSHFSHVIRTCMATAGWGSVGLWGLWTTVSSLDICNKKKSTPNIH